LLPPALLVARCFAEEEAAIEKLETEIAALQQQMEELVEEHGGEEGAFSDLEKINRAEVSRRLKELQEAEAAEKKNAAAKVAEEPVPFGESEESDTGALLEWLNLDGREAELKRKLKIAQESLMERVLQQYARLTEDEIKALVVDDKWLATIAGAVEGELDRVSQTLTGRIRQLAERYATTLPQLTDEVATLASRVEEHLNKMGAVWK